jgi:hypothetical protein
MSWQENLIQRVAREELDRDGDAPLAVQLGPAAALAIIGNLQLALRYPENNGANARIARKLIDALILMLDEAKLPAHAQLARLGDDPGNDCEWTQ